MNYLRFTFKPLEKQELEILVAQLSEIAFEGFEENGPRLTAYIPEKEYDETAFQQIIGYSTSLVENKELILPINWNETWEKNFEPVVVNRFCAVRAHFHEPITNVKHEVIITPKMSFGTGHHATTWMMIDLMETLDLKGKSVLDFGTGTGILAILASQCGAEKIWAIDNDDWSIENAAENIAINNATNIRLEKADQLSMNETFDIILANINKNVLLQNMTALRQHLNNNGVLMMSGLLSGDQEEIVNAAYKNSLKLVTVKTKSNWIALQFD